MQLAILIAAMLLEVLAPRDRSASVHDYANLLTAEQRASLEELFRSVDRQTTAELAVVTVPSLGGQSVDSYANGLFKEWGIGKQGVNNGVLLLVAPKDRRMKIEVGYGIEPLLTDSLCGEIADEFIVPHFKNEDYAGGIMAGAQQLASVLKANPDAARGDPNSGPILARTRARNALVANAASGIAALCLFILGVLVAFRRLYSTTTFFLMTAISATLLGLAAFFTLKAPGPQQPIGWLGGATVASVAAWCLNLARYRRYGPHGCSKCGTQLELLSEQEDDPKLTSVQLLEETLGSVDYDVWICPACLNQDTERYIKNFSGFKECPACHARTFKEDAPVEIQPATTFSSGSARIDGRCVSCNHKSVRMIVLPQIQQSSSSNGSGSFSGGGGGGFSGGGGGGFGGGSSGGGGASRGW
jgi:uncharacterized protein